jgi:hypothetical protein
VHSNLVEFSVNARGYTLATLLLVLGALCAAYALRRDNLVSWGMFIVAAILSLWTVPTMLYAFACVGIWLLLTAAGEPALRRRGSVRSSLLSLLVISGGTVISWLPVVLSVGPARLLELFRSQGQTQIGYLRELSAAMERDLEWLTRDLHGVIACILVLSCAVALLCGPAGRKQGLRRALLAAVVVAILLVLQQSHPPARVWSFLVPPLSILIGSGLAALERRLPLRAQQWKPGRILGGLLAAAALVGLLRNDSIRLSSQTGRFPEAQRISLDLKELARKREPIVAVSPASAPLVYYARRQHIPEEHFMPPGRDLTDDASAIVVASRAEEQSVGQILRELDLHALFDADAAAVLHEYSTATVYRVPGRQQGHKR